MKSEPYRLAAAHVAANLIGGAYLPFFPAWLEARDISPVQTSILLSTAMFLRIFVNPAAGIAADARGDRRLVMIALTVVTAVGYGLLPFVAGFAAIMVCAVAANVTSGASGSILESMTVRSAYERGFHYGHVRLWGSSTFVVANFTSGAVVSWFGIDAIGWWIGIAGAIYVAVCFFLPKPTMPRYRPSWREGIGLTLREAKKLVRHKVFLVFLLSGATAQAGHAFLYAFGTLNWQAQGFGDGLIGFLWALSVAAEVVLFAVSPWIARRFSPIALMTMGGSGAMLRWTVMAMAPPLWIVVPLQLTHALSFAAAHLGAMQFILRSAPGHLASTSQSVYAVLAYGLLMGLTTLASGPLYDAFGAGGFLAMAVLGAISVAAAVWLGRIWHGGPVLAELEAAKTP